MTYPPGALLATQARRVFLFERFMARHRCELPAEDQVLWELGHAPAGLGHGQLCDRLRIDSANLGGAHPRASARYTGAELAR